MLNREQGNRCIDIHFLSDGYRLEGTLHLPPIKNPPVVIGCHGLLSNRDSPKQIELAHRCNANGMAYFRFDHRGCGKSQGQFSQVTTLSGRVHDLIDAIKTMQKHPQTGTSLGLFGSSMGGAVCISVFPDQAVDALVTFAAPVRIVATTQSPHNRLTATVQHRVPEDVSMDFDISNRLSYLHHVLVIHGDADSVVPYQQALEIHQGAKNPKSLVCQKNGDHRMSQRHHQQAFINESVNWYKKCFRRSRYGR